MHRPSTLISPRKEDASVKTLKDDVQENPPDAQQMHRVKDAMIHPWSSYENPRQKDGLDSFGGLGTTMIEALDTLYITGLDQKAREWVATSLDFDKDYAATMFETIIRLHLTEWLEDLMTPAQYEKKKKLR